MIGEKFRTEGLIGPIQYMLQNKKEGFMLSGSFCLKDKVDDVLFSDILACYEMDLLPGEMGLVIEESSQFGDFKDITVLSMSQICGFRLSYQRPAAKPGKGISIDL